MSTTQTIREMPDTPNDVVVDLTHQEIFDVAVAISIAMSYFKVRNLERHDRQKKLRDRLVDLWGANMSGVQDKYADFEETVH